MAITEQQKVLRQVFSPLSYSPQSPPGPIVLHWDHLINLQKFPGPWNHLGLQNKD